MKTRGRHWIALLILGQSGATGCGSAPAVGDDAGLWSDANLGPDAAAAAGEGSDALDLQFGTDGPTTDSTPTGPGCSGDLHDVVDTAGHVTTHCPPDQGCAAGQCIAACGAAAANHDNVGCDFMPAAPSFYAGATGAPCWAVFVANNWGTDVTIHVSYGGTSYDVASFGRIATQGVPESMWPAVSPTGLAKGQVAVLFLEHATSSTPAYDFTCPVPAAIEQGTPISGTGRGHAWHITTSAPVSAYDILPYGGASSTLPGATLLLPTTAWGSNYVGVVPPLGDPHKSPGPQWAQIVAVQDDTVVQIVPTADMPAGNGVAAAPSNQVATYTLAAGEVIQWQHSYTQGMPGMIAGSEPMEISGTVISSNNPVALNVGNAFMCLTSATSTGGGCDSDHEQIPPVSALGSEYAPAPYATRRADLQAESLPYRIVGVVAGTTLTYDPPVNGAPATLDRGQWADFESTTAFVVRSQDSDHPFYIAQMMTGCFVTSGSRDTAECLGDEDFVTVMPPAQFLNSYVFFTDTTYPTTTLTVVRNRASSGFADVNVDCLGTITGWQAIGTSGAHEWATVDLVRGDAGTSACSNGPHVASSAGSFGVTVWGEAYAASYGYPAGTNLAPINGVVVQPVPR